MKNGVGYITLTDGKVHFLLRPDRQSEPLMLTAPASTAEEGADAVLDFAMDNGLDLTRAVVAMDGRDCFVRNFALPIRGGRQLDQVVSFELEDDLPLSGQELVTDYFRGSGQDGTSYVLAAAAKKSVVADLLSAFEAKGVQVEKLDLDVAAFARACGARTGEYESSVGLDIGTDRTLFCLLAKGRVRMGAVIPWGESDLVDAVAKAGDMSREEVGRLMVMGDGADDDTSELLDTHLEKFLQKMLREVYRLLGEHEWPRRFVVSGEIVRNQRFRSIFESVSDGSLDVWEESCLKLGDEVDLGQRGLGLAVGYGTAEESGGSLNLLKGEFAFAGGNTAWVREALYLGVLLLAVGLAWGGYAYSSVVSGERELAYIRSATTELYKEALPGVQEGLAPMQYQSILSSRLESLTGQTAGGQEADTAAVIDTLLTVSKVLNRKIDVEFISLNLDLKRMDIQGQTRTMKDVDSIRGALVKTKSFNQVKVKNATADKRTKRIRFEIEVDR